MNKSFNILFVIISLFVSLVFGSKMNAQTTISTPTKTPNRRKSAQIAKIELDKNEILIPCIFNGRVFGELCKDEQPDSIQVKITVHNPKNKRINYQYTVSAGRIIGQGEKVIWDLKNVSPGDYTITASFDSGKGFGSETKSEKVSVKECYDCDPPCVCPALSVSGGGSIKGGETVDFTANVSIGTAFDIKYKWTVSQGEIVLGQGTPNITVKTTSAMSGYVQATVEISGDFCAECLRTASETGTIIQ